MIYEFKVANSGNVKTMLLTADTLGAFYRRIADMYGLTKDEVSLVAEYEETENFGYRLKKSYVKTDKKKDKKLIDKAVLLFKQGDDRSKRLVEPRKSDYIKRHKFNSCPISTADDVYELLIKYKTVKVYWENGIKRGTHSYFAVYK